MRMLTTKLGGAVLALTLMAGLSTPALAQAANDIDFGDDSGQWSNDGECDDPRFEGNGMAAELEDADISKDATDCRTAFEAGTITLIGAGAGTATGGPATPPPLPRSSEIDFGDDSGNWANDGECDDPRFTGAGMAAELEDADILKDATDCRTAFEAGTITLADEGDIPATGNAEIDFGDDSGEWAKDGECDDARFTGSGMAVEVDDSHILKDASDCRAAFEDGTIALEGEDAQQAPASTISSSALEALANRVDFGDDSGDWPNDGECDDPDFTGPGMTADPYDDNRLGDATDCRAAFLAGSISLKSGQTVVAGFDYGSDYSRWANDGQCDDLRFTGPGMAKKLGEEDVGADATDCRTLEEQGEVSIKPVYLPDYALNGPYDSAGVDFGNNSSSYANDNICDDPRFEGPGVATTLLDSDRLADAEDCRAAFEKGTITLRNGEG